jgi:hypothetical protein
MNVMSGFPTVTPSFTNCLRNAVSPMLMHCSLSCDAPTCHGFALSLPGRSHDVENTQRPLLELIEALLLNIFPHRTMILK